MIGGRLPFRRLGGGRLLLVVAIGLLAAGCSVDATFDVRVRENGSGVVRLLVDTDAEAVRAVESGGLPLEDAVRLDDLGDDGWQVGAWNRAEDGSASIVLTRPYEAPSQLEDIVREASGDSGPLSLAATRTKGFLATEYGVAGKVDLANVTTGVPTDAELLANLSAQSVDPAVIDQQLLAQLKSSFAIEVVVRLPGEAPQRFAAEPGAITSIDAIANVRDMRRLMFLVAALMLAVLAVVLWIRGGRPRPRRQPKPPQGPRPPARPPTRSKPGGLEGPPRRGPHLPHVPKPHVPHPHLPHPHMPGRPRPPGPPPRKQPPDDRPPMIPPGMT